MPSISMQSRSVYVAQMVQYLTSNQEAKPSDQIEIFACCYMVAYLGTIDSNLSYHA